MTEDDILKLARMELRYSGNFDPTNDEILAELKRLKSLLKSHTM